MSTPGAPPVFLERRSYRRRRLMDACRLLPVLGLMLWMVPLLWPSRNDVPAGQSGADPIAMSSAIIFVFAVWTILIVLGALLWRARAHGAAQDEDLAPRDEAR